MERWLDLPSAFSRWWVEGATRAALEARQKVDLVVASMSPFESADVAARVGDALGVPWVADLRDPWALDEMVVYPTGIHRRLARRRMRSALESASGVVMNTPEATRRLREAFSLGATPVTTITDGFETRTSRHRNPRERTMPSASSTRGTSTPSSARSTGGADGFDDFSAGHCSTSTS